MALDWGMSDADSFLRREIRVLSRKARGKSRNRLGREMKGRSRVCATRRKVNWVARACAHNARDRYRFDLA